PLSPLQEGLLFLGSYDAQAADVYTVQLVLSLDGLLDPAPLERSLQVLVQRHSSLRAAFVSDELGAPVQVIVSNALAPMRSLDLSQAAEAERETLLNELLASDRDTRFKLTQAPLVRFALIRLGLRQHQLVITSHHILMDGWSMPILVRELLTLYAHRGDPSA